MNYLFVSFDLFNSTAFKYKYKNWFKLYCDILQSIEKNVTKNGFTLWKAIGDELVFNKTLSVKNIKNDIEKINKLMAELLKDIYENGKSKELFPDIKQLSIKTAMWIIHTENSCIESTDYELKINDRDDYLGKEMDTGFRMSSYALRSKTVLSASIVFLLCKYNKEVLNRIRIIGYNKMKGIWDNYEYPICVYFRNRNILGSFHQSERNIEMVRNFIEKLEKSINFGKINSRDFLEYLDFMGIKDKYESNFC